MPGWQHFRILVYSCSHFLRVFSFRSTNVPWFEKWSDCVHFKFRNFLLFPGNRFNFLLSKDAVGTLTAFHKWGFKAEFHCKHEQAKLIKSLTWQNWKILHWSSGSISSKHGMAANSPSASLFKSCHVAQVSTYFLKQRKMVIMIYDMIWQWDTVDYGPPPPPPFLTTY